MDTHNLKQAVEEYLDVMSKLQVMRDQSKALTQKKKELTEAIITDMTEKKMDACKLQNGHAIVLKPSLRMETLKPEMIKTSLEEFFQSGGTHNADDAVAQILSSREETTSMLLKIVKNK